MTVDGKVLLGPLAVPLTKITQLLAIKGASTDQAIAELVKSLVIANDITASVPLSPHHTNTHVRASCADYLPAFNYQTICWGKTGREMRADDHTGVPQAD